MAITALQIIFFLFVSAIPLVASDIAGQVRAFSSSDLLKAATVQLLRDRLPLDERLLGSDGRFEFRNLPVGSYIIRIRAAGFSDEEVPVLLMRNSSREMILVELRPVNQASEKPGVAVSITEYQIPRAAKREFQRGLEDRKRGRCAKAIPHLQKAVAAFDKYGDAFNELGHCFRQSEDFIKAEESYRKAIEYGSTIYPSINLGDLYLARKRYSDAQEVLRQSLTKYPTEGDLYFALARLHFDQDHMKEAEDAALEAHSRVHRAADVHILLAKIYLKLERYPALVSQLRLYLDENPTGPLADQVRKNLAEMNEP